jgi:hypothetical protein
MPVLPRVVTADVGIQHLIDGFDFRFLLDFDSRNCLIAGMEKALPAASSATICNARYETSVTSPSQLCSLLSEGAGKALRLMDRTDAGAVPGWPQAVFNITIMLYTIFLGWKPRPTRLRLYEFLKVLLPFSSITWWLIAGSRRRLGVAGDWESLENGSRWAS